jgi:hypothetical protein
LFYLDVYFQEALHLLDALGQMMEASYKADSTMTTLLVTLGLHHHQEDGHRDARSMAADTTDVARTAHNPYRDRCPVGAQDTDLTLLALILAPSQGEETLGEAQGIADVGVQATAATVREMAVFLVEAVAQAGAEAIDHLGGEGDSLFLFAMTPEMPYG